MRSLVIFLSLFYNLVSCGHNLNVREMAIQNNVYSTVNGIIEYYSECNYRLPEDFDQVLDFLAEWKKHDPESYLYDSFYPKEKSFIEFLKNNYPKCEFHADSVFLYFPSWNLGTCVYGHPFYWLEHPERFPEERHDYFDNFRPSIFDHQGKFIFNFDLIDKLTDEIDSIKEKYSNMVMVNNKLKNVEIIPEEPFINANLICSYDGSGDIKIETPLPEEFFILDKTSNKLTPGAIDLRESLNPLYEELTDLMRKTLIENPAVDKVMFTTELHFN